MPPKLSVSDLNHFLDCPHACVWRLKHKLWTPPGPAARLGTLLHAYLQYRLLGATPPSHSDLVDDADIYPDYVRCLTSLEAWTPDFITLSTEKALDLRVWPWFTIVGRLDALVTDEEGTWSFQIKSMSKGKSPSNTIARVRLSHHEVTYHKLAEQAGIKLQGTILLTIRNLSQKDIAANVSPLIVTRLRRTKEEVDEIWLRDILPNFIKLHEATEIASEPNAEHLIQHNWQSCISRYNQRCPLFDACHGCGTPDTSRLEVLVDRYPEIS
jgi:hypothetical protein